MENKNEKIKKQYDAIGWGALFILIGILSFFPGNKWNVFFIGFGAIVLARNILLYLFHKITPEWFMVIIGAIVLIAGIANEFNRAGFPVQLHFFDIVIIVVGIAMLIKGIWFNKKEK